MLFTECNPSGSLSLCTDSRRLKEILLKSPSAWYVQYCMRSFRAGWMNWAESRRGKRRVPHPQMSKHLHPDICWLLGTGSE